MKVDKANRRDRKINRRSNGMVVDGRGYTVIEQEKKKRAEKIKREREEKEKQLDD